MLALALEYHAVDVLHELCGDRRSDQRPMLQIPCTTVASLPRGMPQGVSEENIGSQIVGGSIPELAEGGSHVDGDPGNVH